MAEAREFESLYALSYQMRKRFLEIFTRLGFGHVTTAFSATEILLTLYKEVLCYQAENPNWGGRDRFVLSKGHGAGMLFPIFEEIETTSIFAVCFCPAMIFMAVLSGMA